MQRVMIVASVALLLASCSREVRSQAAPGQSPETSAKSNVPRTASGQPELQGMWTFETFTPLERPQALEGKAFFASEEEAARFAREEGLRVNRDLNPVVAGGVVPYNEFWYERSTEVSPTLRTALIVNPASGRLPAMTPYAQHVREQLSRGPGSDNGPPPRSYKDINLWTRCLMAPNAVPLAPSFYNNNVLLIQARDYLAIVPEMIHEQRIVAFDGRPHPNARQWAGTSRGHWEGDTLVVETRNFRIFRDVPLLETADVQLTERFARVGPASLLYTFTVDAPAIWAEPWTAEVPMRKSTGTIYEYACHEGNYALSNVLAGARAQRLPDDAER